MSNKNMSQEIKDEMAFIILRDIVQLGRNGYPYKDRLADLKKALNNSPKASEYVKQIIKGLE